MKYLIDTQVFIWLNTDINRLTRKFVTLSQSGQNEFYLSMASVWEMQIEVTGYQRNRLFVFTRYLDLFAS